MLIVKQHISSVSSSNTHSQYLDDCRLWVYRDLKHWRRITHKQSKNAFKSQTHKNRWFEQDEKESSQTDFTGQNTGCSWRAYWWTTGAEVCWGVGVGNEESTHEWLNPSLERPSRRQDAHTFLSFSLKREGGYGGMREARVREGCYRAV